HTVRCGRHRRGRRAAGQRDSRRPPARRAPGRARRPRRARRWTAAWAGDGDVRAWGARGHRRQPAGTRRPPRPGRPGRRGRGLGRGPRPRHGPRPMTRIDMAPRLGLRANWAQFSLLVAVNALVGGMVGQERTVLPLLAEQVFAVGAFTASLAFIVAFGVTKALTNLAAGTLSDRYGRKPVLVAGWLIGVPVPLLLIWAPTWGWVIGDVAHPTWRARSVGVYRLWRGLGDARGARR